MVGLELKNLYRFYMDAENVEESNECLAEDLHLIRRAIECVGPTSNDDSRRASVLSNFSAAGINSLPPFFRGSISSAAPVSPSRTPYDEGMKYVAEAGSTVGTPLSETQNTEQSEANDTLTPLLNDSLSNDREIAKVEGKLNKSR